MYPGPATGLFRLFRLPAAKRALGVGRRGPGELAGREPHDLGQETRCPGQVGRLIGPAPDRMRAEVGAIRLDENPIERNRPGRIAERIPGLAGEGDHAGERDVQPELEKRRGMFGVSRK